MWILSVDPGRESGWCIRGPDGVADHGAVDGSHVASVDRIVSGYNQTSRGPRMVVIEGQQAYSAFRDRRGKLVKPAFASIRTLIRRAEIWAVLAERLGMRVERVSASTWQAHLHLRGTHEQRMRGLRVLLRASGYSRAAACMTEDECCACGIDLWASAQGWARDPR